MLDFVIKAKRRRCNLVVTDNTSIDRWEAK